MITKDQALELLHSYTQNQNLRRHMYAVGAVMKALAVKLGGNPEEWEILGLLHDADWEETKDIPHEHTKRTLAWLKDLGVSQGPVIHALMSHNNKLTHLAELEGKMEWALETCDELTGFIVAVALVRPDPSSLGASEGQGKSRLQLTTVESVLKKWKNKEFARAVDRDQIAQCEEKLGIPLGDFIQLSLTAMQQISSDLGL